MKKKNVIILHHSMIIQIFIFINQANACTYRCYDYASAFSGPDA